MHQKQTASKRELIILGSIYLVGFVILGISPHDRADWALENFFPIAQLVAVVIFYRYFKFTYFILHDLLLFVRSVVGRSLHVR